MNESQNIGVNVDTIVPASVGGIASVSASVIHVTQVRDFLYRQRGRFVNVVFTKLDGCQRSLNGRLGVRCHLKGGSNMVERPSRPYLVVYDVKTPGYRVINLATVKVIRAQHVDYSVIG